MPLPDALSSVIALDDPRATLAHAGGKAVHLGAMIRAKMPVPTGFVVTTDAYRAFVAANAIELAIERAWDDAQAGPEAIERASALVRRAFALGVIPPALADAITAAYAALPTRDAPVAVRSSATAEDLPDASFAGQQDTFLNVRGAAALLDAVRRCWGGLWTARAIAYRARQGIPPAHVALAVIVQRMAPATASGVMFTAHPLTGRADVAVINATFGLGEALVSGRVNPDSLVVHKASGRVLRATLGEKARMTAATDEGTAEVEVPETRRASRALTDADAAALVSHGRALEALFGGPQDVEWAIADGQPVLLQSRAVTSRAPEVPGDDAWPPTERPEAQAFDFWTQQDMGERWPDPVTPLTWSICEPMNQTLMEGMFPGLKAPWAGRIQWTCRAHGHVYMNEGALLYAFTHGYGMPLSLAASGLTHPGAAPADADGWKLRKALAHAGYFWEAMTTWEKRVDALERAFPQIDAWVEDFMARDLADDSDAALLTEAHDVWYARILEHVAPHTHATSLAMSAYAELEAFVKRYAGDASLAQVLVGGITGVIAAEMVPALDAMASSLHALGLASVVIERPPADALAALRSDERAGPFLALFAGFLKRHGHRCKVEAELRLPRWREAPEQVIELLAPYLQRSARATTADAGRRREEATAALYAKLGPFGRMGLRRALDRAHRFTRMRDNGQGYVVKLLMPLRALYAELGRRHCRRGWLRSADDAFFLLREELAAVAAAGSPSGASLDLQGLADARRRAHAHWCTQSPPDALDAAREPVAAAGPGDDPNTLVGVGASRGTVTGVARVVLSPEEAGRLQPGEILVTRATDPGWTPVFSVIGGAVLEIGGLLSHGAIVAREYGLPAVVNVAGCTRRIAEGQTITVDGATGRVTLHG